MSSPDLNWPSILKKLAETEFDFLVVGGGALALHGIPRTTLDLDIYFPVDDKTLSSFISFVNSELKLESRNKVDLNLGADLLVGQWLFFSVADGPDIMDVYLCRPGEYYSLTEAADLIDLDGSEVAVAGLDSLRDMKAKAGRAIDLADIALIDEFKELFD